jgi:RNA polymerase sigma-70 factor, ECF subfamily
MEVSAVYTQFHQQLLNYVRSKIQSKEDAEDIVQNVFIKISSNIDKLSEDTKLKSWIFTITRNAIIDYYRINANKKKITIGGELEEGIFEDDEPDTTKGLDQCMESMIGLLPDEYRDVIVDSEIKGIRQKDLAEKYGIAYPSMRSRVQRGRERLKQIFQNCCHIETDRRGNVLDAQSKNGCGGSCDPCS